jgi:uncharacterized protein (DUF4415 family)
MKRKGSITSYSAEELKAVRARGEGRSDWTKVDSVTDEELERLIAEDADEAPLPDTWPEGIEVGLPRPKMHMNLRVDADVVDWFKRHGRGYQTRMNAVLRAFVEAQRRDGRS